MTEIQNVVPVGPVVLGNTKPKRNRISASKRWVFTLHNYSTDDITFLNTEVPDVLAKYLIFSEEVGATGETPHLQGYIEFKRECRPFEKFTNKTYHWEKSKGTRAQNVKYIEKENGTIWCNGRIKVADLPIGSLDFIANEIKMSIEYSEGITKSVLEQLRAGIEQ